MCGAAARSYRPTRPTRKPRRVSWPPQSRARGRSNPPDRGGLTCTHLHTQQGHSNAGTAETRPTASAPHAKCMTVLVYLCVVCVWTRVLPRTALVCVCVYISVQTPPHPHARNAHAYVRACQHVGAALRNRFVGTVPLHTRRHSQFDVPSVSQ